MFGNWQSIQHQHDKRRRGACLPDRGQEVFPSYKPNERERFWFSGNKGLGNGTYILSLSFCAHTSQFSAPKMGRKRARGCVEMGKSFTCTLKHRYWDIVYTVFHPHSHAPHFARIERVLCCCWPVSFDRHTLSVSTSRSAWKCTRNLNFVSPSSSSSTPSSGTAFRANQTIPSLEMRL